MALGKGFERDGWLTSLAFSIFLRMVSLWDSDGVGVLWDG